MGIGGFRRRNSDNVMNIFGRIILIIMLATVVVPVGYLAWRAGQPMDLPQFHGLTYYQYLSWRMDALHQMAVLYKASHPIAKMGGGLDMCFQDEIGITMFLGLPMTGFYTLAGAFPNLEKYVSPDGRKYIPREVTLLSFLPDWWITYENVTWYLVDARTQDPVQYCRLAGTLPTSASPDP